MENAERIFFILALICLGTCMFFSLLRAIRGPRQMDRVVGLNMTGTLSLLCLAVCSFLLKESWLLDVCMIYALISFLAVTVLSVLRIDSKSDSAKKEEDGPDV